MAITKETQIGKIEVVGEFKSVQVSYGYCRLKKMANLIITDKT
jgi:hypothetical protein